MTLPRLSAAGNRPSSMPPTPRLVRRWNSDPFEGSLGHTHTHTLTHTHM